MNTGGEGDSQGSGDCKFKSKAGTAEEECGWRGGGEEWQGRLVGAAGVQTM